MSAFLSCVILGACRTKKNSSQLIRPGLILPSKAYLTYEKMAVPQLRMAWAGKNPLKEPLNLCARFYRDRDAGDLVGYLQALCDVLEKAGVVEDDKWIKGFDGSRLMLDRVHPETALVLTPLDG